MPDSTARWRHDRPRWDVASALWDAVSRPRPVETVVSTLGGGASAWCEALEAGRGILFAAASCARCRPVCAPPGQPGRITLVYLSAHAPPATREPRRDAPPRSTPTSCRR